MISLGTGLIRQVLLGDAMIIRRISSSSYVLNLYNDVVHVLGMTCCGNCFKFCRIVLTLSSCQHNMSTIFQLWVLSQAVLKQRNLASTVNLLFSIALLAAWNVAPCSPSNVHFPSPDIDDDDDSLALSRRGGRQESLTFCNVVPSSRFAAFSFAYLIHPWC